MSEHIFILLCFGRINETKRKKHNKMERNKMGIKCKIYNKRGKYDNVLLLRLFSSSYHSAKQSSNKRTHSGSMDQLYSSITDIHTHRYDVGFEGTDWKFVVGVSTIKLQMCSVGESHAIHVISSDISIVLVYESVNTAATVCFFHTL